MPFDFRTVFNRALPYNDFLARYATDDHRTRWQQVYDAVSLTDPQLKLLTWFRRKMNVLCMAGPWCGDCVNACPIFQKIAEACPDRIDLRFVNRAQNFDPNANAAPRPGTADDPNDIRSTQLGKVLVKLGFLTPERVEKAVLAQDEQRAKGLNVRIGDVMTGLGFITPEQRDQALAAQSGYENLSAWDVAVAKELSICGAPRVPVLVFLSQDWFECERFGERTLATYREKAKTHLSKLEGASCPTGIDAPSTTALANNTAEWLEHFERIQWMLLTSPRLQKLNGEL
ncbi:MAG: thioredoxin family protein [Phycisphaerae bacterium]